MAKYTIWTENDEFENFPDSEETFQLRSLLSNSNENFQTKPFRLFNWKLSN